MRGPVEASERIRLVVGVIGDACHRRRMQCLDEERLDATDECSPVGVYGPRHALRAEPAVVVRGEPHLWLVFADDVATDDSLQLSADALHRGQEFLGHSATVEPAPRPRLTDQGFETDCR